MKKITKFIFCLMAMATLCAGACEDDIDDNNNDAETSYSELIVGTWLIDNITVDSETMTPEENMLIYMYSDGTGLFDHNGVTENNEFTWSIEGDQLTIVPRSGTTVFTIVSMTDSECIIRGHSIPGQDEVDADVIIHMTRQQ